LPELSRESALPHSPAAVMPKVGSAASSVEAEERTARTTDGIRSTELTQSHRLMPRPTSNAQEERTHMPRSDRPIMRMSVSGPEVPSYRLVGAWRSSKARQSRESSTQAIFVAQNRRMASRPRRANARLGMAIPIPLLAVLVSCSPSHGPEEATVSAGQPPLTGGPAAEVDSHSKSPASAQDWLDTAVREMRNSDQLSFGSHLYSTGFEIQVSTGTADPSGYRIVQRKGKDAASEAPDVSLYYYANKKNVRIRADDEGWPEERDATQHLVVWGLGALSPHRTDLVTILHSLSTDSSTPMDEAGFTGQADLGTVLRIITGTSFRGPNGNPAFPRGSMVPVSITPGATRIERLHLDGDEVEQALNDLGLDKSGSLAGALHAFEVTIDYP
jgi:hypothetical protein